MGIRTCRKLLSAFAFFAAVTLVACSASPSPSPQTSGPPTNSWGGGQPEAGSTPSSIGSSTIPPTKTWGGGQPEVRHKQIGEKASLGCQNNDPASPCDVDFTIVAIQQDAQCDDPYGGPLKADQQFVKFDVEIQTAQHFMFPDSESALFLQNWGIGLADGVDKNLVEHSMDGCGDQISKFLVPGEHETKSVVVTAPKPATTLRLYQDAAGNGWTWDIPPAGR